MAKTRMLRQSRMFSYCALGQLNVRRRRQPTWREARQAGGKEKGWEGNGQEVWEGTKLVSNFQPHRLPIPPPSRDAVSQGCGGRDEISTAGRWRWSATFRGTVCFFWSFQLCSAGASPPRRLTFTIKNDLGSRCGQKWVPGFRFCAADSAFIYACSRCLVRGRRKQAF
jgi:hypothetical protein